MSQTLILELSDEIYTIIQRQAEAAGTPPAHWLAQSLEHQYGHSHTRHGGGGAQHTAAEQQAARERFERHFGAVDLADATGANNEQIDADLASA
ncbi:MAG: hypothetical protein OEU26_27340 [Candidatus Tectomicrobia bacterium]|nr:hypothetical protein [Candidatus Tectomicrobia bacterium]